MIVDDLNQNCLLFINANHGTDSEVGFAHRIDQILHNQSYG